MRREVKVIHWYYSTTPWAREIYQQLYIYEVDEYNIDIVIKYPGRLLKRLKEIEGRKNV